MLLRSAVVAPLLLSTCATGPLSCIAHTWVEASASERGTAASLISSCQRDSLITVAVTAAAAAAPASATMSVASVASLARPA